MAHTYNSSPREAEEGGCEFKTILTLWQEHLKTKAKPKSRLVQSPPKSAIGLPTNMKENPKSLWGLLAQHYLFCLSYFSSCCPTLPHWLMLYSHKPPDLLTSGPWHVLFPCPWYHEPLPYWRNVFARRHPLVTWLRLAPRILLLELNTSDKEGASKTR